MVPFTKNQFLYNWHWFWATGNGDIGNQGVHEMDIARWGLGVDFPRSVVGSGGKYVYDDDQETPNTIIARFDYGDKELVFEVRGLPTNHEADLSRTDSNCIGNLFYGSDGWMAVDAEGYRVYKGQNEGKLAEQAKYEEPAMTDTMPHIANFLAAVRSRKYQDLHADVDVGRISADLCHLANISYRLGGRLLAFDRTTEKFDENAANQQHIHNIERRTSFRSLREQRRTARACYSHLAATLGVCVFTALKRSKVIESQERISRARTTPVRRRTVSRLLSPVSRLLRPQ